MSKNTLESLSESMFYVLVALLKQPRCGKEITEFVSMLTHNRVNIGPGTLYTILSKYEEENVIEEIAVEGRKRTYQIKERGHKLYLEEKTRMYAVLADAEGVERS